ncbi:MAG: DNA helicase PcrA [Clostridia bacterium]|nr:DNA helicase PcrA [Clostridia bacterium]
MLVLAGAGSGKTKVLVTRIAYLIQEKKVRPGNILAITFTNKAAAEMKSRITQMIPEEIRELWVSTFHSACLRILRQNIEHIGYENNFVVYDESDRQVLIKDCLKELNLDDKKYFPRSVIHAVSQAKNQLLSPEEFAEQAYDFSTQVTARIYALYQQKLKKNNAVDFDDLLLLTVKLFQNKAEVLARYQQKFQYILVDEYQDTNYAQYILVKLLSESRQNVCVVGDPDQSIYNFRGADIRNILDFEKDYPQARLIKLEQNYRSTGNILEAANSLIQYNTERKEKKLWTSAGKGQALIRHLANDEKMEAYYVAGRIENLVKNNKCQYSDIAVLYRTHAMSRNVEEVFGRRAIPYTIIGGLKFYDRREIKDLLAYLRVVSNPLDLVSLTRIVNVPKRGIGDVSLQRLLDYAVNQTEGNGIKALLQAREAGLTGKALRAAEQLGEILLELNLHSQKNNVRELTQKVLQITGYWDSLAEEDSIESRGRLENLKEFLSVVQNFEQSQEWETDLPEERTLVSFLSQISLVADVDNLQESNEKVVLMTLHSAKGLEFPVVFLIGLEEGIFPYAHALNNDKEMEEERRLAYVGITRAEKMLYLTHCWQRTLFGTTRFNLVSRFLEEIPGRLVLNQNLSGNQVQKESPDSFPAESKKTIKEKAVKAPARLLKLQVGDQVNHQKWGLGTVLAVKGNGENTEAKVDCLVLGVKDLLLKFAPLQKIE